MATSFASPADSGYSDPGAEMFAELGDTLDSAIPDETPAPDGQLAETAPDDIGSDLGTEETTPAPQGNEPYPLNEDGTAYQVPKAELANYTGMKQYVGEVQKHFPTVSDAKLSYQQSSDFRAMQQDFMYPDQGSMERMLNFWSGGDAQDPGVRSQMQQSFSELAAKMPDHLKTVNPQAYDQMATQVIGSRIESAYAKAAQSGDPADFQRAQWLDWGATGQYKTELPKANPRAAQQQQEQSRLQDIDRRETAMMDRDFKAYNTSQMDGAKWAAVNSEIDKVLQPVKDKYDAEEFAEIRTSVQNKLIQTLQSDTEWARTHNGERRALEQEFRRVWKSGQDPSSAMKSKVNGYINDLMVRARLHLPSIAAPRLSKATTRAVQNAQPRQPQPRTQQPSVAPNRQKAPQPHVNIHEDPEFAKLFKIPA